MEYTNYTRIVCIWFCMLMLCSFLISAGLGVNILLVNPEKAIKLAVNDQARAMLGGRR